MNYNSEHIRCWRPALSGGRISHEDIIEFAQQLGIAPGIVVGRMQHAGLVPRQNLNGLKQHLRWVTENEV